MCANLRPSVTLRCGTPLYSNSVTSKNATLSAPKVFAAHGPINGAKTGAALYVSYRVSPCNLGLNHYLTLKAVLPAAYLKLD